MTKRFFVNTPQSGIRFGKNLRTNGTTIEPGVVVKLDSSGSTASLCDVAESPLGIAYGERHEVYTPQTRVFANAEKLVVVTGNYLALLSADFFSSGSLPGTSPTTLYTAASGLIGTSSAGSATKIGEYLRTEAVMQPIGGTGTSQDLAFCRFNVQP